MTAQLMPVLRGRNPAAEFGETERLLGCEAVQFFGILKIFEAERKTSGLPSWKIFSFGAKNRGAMPLMMEPFNLEDGDLDRYLVMRLFQLCKVARTLRFPSL